MSNTDFDFDKLDNRTHDQDEMRTEGDALAGLARGMPASFPIIDARTRQSLFWLCPDHKEEYRFALDSVVGDELDA